MFVPLSISDVVFNFNIQLLQYNEQNNMSPGIFSLESFSVYNLSWKQQKLIFQKCQPS